MDNIVNFKPKQTTIEVELVESSFLTRWPCTVCGGCTEKVPILAEGRQDLSSGDINVGEYRTIRVCENCLQFGEIDARLELGARQLEAQAQSLREMIGRLRVPTFAEWQARCEQHELEWREDYEKATGEKMKDNGAQSDSDGGEIPF